MPTQKTGKPPRLRRSGCTSAWRRGCSDGQCARATCGRAVWLSSQWVARAEARKLRFEAPSALSQSDFACSTRKPDAISWQR